MSNNDLIITNRVEVRKKWGKSHTEIQKDIEIVRDFLKTQKHLPEVPSDNMIEFMLTNCKFSIEKTKQNFDMYYTIRSLMPDIFEKSNPNLPNHQSVFNMAYYFPLPNLTDTLHRIMLLKYKEDTADIFDPYKMLIYGTNIYEVRMHEDLVMGDIIFMDCQHFKMGHIVKYTPTVFKKIMFTLERVWSNRLKEIHILNYPPYIDRIMSMVKPFMKEKLYQRIFLHPSLDSLYKELPKTLLPSEYGGEEKSIEDMAESWKLKFKECSERFDKLDKIRVDESLRSEPLINSEDLGFYGNFKKLDVD